MIELTQEELRAYLLLEFGFVEPGEVGSAHVYGALVHRILEFEPDLRPGRALGKATEFVYWCLYEREGHPLTKPLYTLTPEDMDDDYYK